VGPGEPWERILTGPGMNFFLKIPVGKDPGNLQVHLCSALMSNGGGIVNAGKHNGRGVL
jgi:hypothetical protein